ncbi:hypothetical protein LTR37_006916 [Vermiconidia calcicola]|uniref:Uncharacterized protein n=1 Tax=Vermiconidia calcicola TaxID=1690605 RepID=A0ACC3NG58_9PEZI|nr:hypothetical protein LTR37_006916 [Vermiconidia calcicola]
MATSTGVQDSRPTKRLKINYSHEVTVLVGDTSQRFMVHKDILCWNSPFFQAACSKNWWEGIEKIIRLPDHAPIAFSIYVDWRYQGVVDLWQGDEHQQTTITDTEGEERPDDGPRNDRLIRSYILGDMLQDYKFCNVVIDAWFDLFEGTLQIPHHDNINLIFDTFPETSKLRQLITHELAFDTMPETYKDQNDRYNPQVWKAIAEMSVTEADIAHDLKKPKTRGKCFYHVHAEGEARCS